MDTIGILNSYNIPGLPGRKTGRIRSFLGGLAEGGLEEGRDFEVRLVDTDQPTTVAEEAGRMVEASVGLIHAVGTINAVAAARATSEVPVVYYGAHPEGRGDAECAAPNITGLLLTLPLTQDARSFQLVKDLVPAATVIYTPFLRGTVFVSEWMDSIHRAARAGRSPHAWLSSRDGPVGFESLARVAGEVGLEYRELVYEDLAELAEAVEGINPRESILMPFNESFFGPGVPGFLLNMSLERKLPLIWNNNAYLAGLGALAGIGADFEAAGLTCGRIAAAILRGRRPAEIPRAGFPVQRAWVNLDTAELLGLAPSPKVLQAFDRHLRGRDLFDAEPAGPIGVDSASTDSIASQVRTRFAAIMRLDPAEIDMDARLDDAYGVDSLESLRLISEIEVQLGVGIPEELLPELRTLNDVVRACERCARAA
jgi:putative ABC transport system substrate-binding protein